MRWLLSAALAAQPLPALAQVKNPDTFVYAIIGDVDSLDPAWHYDGISHEMTFHIYETLIYYKGSALDEFEPLAASVVPSEQNGLVSKDGLRYAFPIRKNVRFHDGTIMTPEDVRYSILRFMLLDRAGGPSQLLLEPLLGVNTVAPDGKPDDKLFDAAQAAVRIEAGAVVLRLKQPYAPLLSVLAGFCPIVSKDFTVKNGGWDGTKESWAKHWNPAKNQSALYDRANGTGPFKLERWDKQNRQLILARHDGYWRAPPKLKRVVFRTVGEVGARKLLLQAGDADAIFMERQFLPQVENVPGVRVFDDLPFLEVHNAFIFTFNVDTRANPFVGSGRLDGRGIPPDFFADIDLRRAFAFAFDYEAYIRDGYRGKGERARGPIPKGVFGYNPRQAVRPFDIERATTYFRRAHGGLVWENGFQLTCAYMDGRADRQLACEILKKNVEFINPRFKIDVRGIQWSTYLSMWNARKLPLINGRWSLDFPDPHNGVMPFLHSEGHYAKVQGYKNPKMDALIASARSERNPGRRKQLYAEILALAFDDVPAVFTIDTYNVQVRRDWVKGWVYNPIIPYGNLYTVYKEAR